MLFGHLEIHLAAVAQAEIHEYGCAGPLERLVLRPLPVLIFFCYASVSSVSGFVPEPNPASSTAAEPALEATAGSRIPDCTPNQPPKSRFLCDFCARVEIQPPKVDEQLKLLKQQRRQALEETPDRGSAIASKLMLLRAVGEASSWLLSYEIFAWRVCKNRRQLGSLAGLTPTPFQSGQDNREQGIDKAGLRWVRPMLVELAWGWLRYQPNSEISIWFNKRFGRGSKRSRKIGIVAVARKLLIALWRFSEQDIMPRGAVLKPVLKA